MYWKHILSVDQKELIYRVYPAQKLSLLSRDWINLLEEDKEQFGLNLSDEDVRKISKHKFKSYVKKNQKI